MKRERKAEARRILGYRMHTPKFKVAIDDYDLIKDTLTKAQDKVVRDYIETLRGNTNDKKQ
jgi:hypothetical protein